MFISNIIKKLFGKKPLYSLKFSEKPIVGSPRDEDIRHADILNPEAIERFRQQRTEVFRFSRKTVSFLLLGENCKRKPEPVIYN